MHGAAIDTSTTLSCLCSLRQIAGPKFLVFQQLHAGIRGFDNHDPPATSGYGVSRGSGTMAPECGFGVVFDIWLDTVSAREGGFLYDDYDSAYRFSQCLKRLLGRLA